jgi:hypothetical protein
LEQKKDAIIEENVLAIVKTPRFDRLMTTSTARHELLKIAQLPSAFGVLGRGFERDKKGIHNWLAKNESIATSRGVDRAKTISNLSADNAAKFDQFLSEKFRTHKRALSKKVEPSFLDKKRLPLSNHCRKVFCAVSGESLNDLASRSNPWEWREKGQSTDSRMGKQISVSMHHVRPSTVGKIKELRQR